MDTRTEIEDILSAAAIGSADEGYIPNGTPVEPLDHDQANRLLFSLRQTEAEADQFRDVAEKMIADIRAEADRHIETLLDKADWCRGSLELFHRKELAQNPKAKTIQLPCGTLVSSAQQPEWDIDDDTYMKWALERNPETDTVKFPPPPDPKVMRTEVKKEFKDAAVSDGKVVLPDGEVVPGITVTERGRKFTPKPNTEV